MPSQADFETWISTSNFPAIAVALIEMEADRGVFDLPFIGQNPEGSLKDNAEVTVEYDQSPTPGCSVYGHYQHRANAPATIYIHPALSFERDNFTLLHELGHHVQRQHASLANVLYARPRMAAQKLEERIANEFAAEILIPASTVAPDQSWLSARVLSDVYARVRASRSAVAMRASEILPDHIPAVFIVANGRGVVTFARASTDELHAPARGRTQPSLARLISRAAEENGVAQGELSNGIEFSSGWIQHGLRADVALDNTLTYAFAVVRPTQGFGDTTSWERNEFECPHATCGKVFVVDNSITICSKCSTPKCPECGACTCEPAVGTICPKCTMQLSPAEVANPSIHQCL